MLVPCSVLTSMSAINGILLLIHFQICGHKAASFSFSYGRASVISLTSVCHLRQTRGRPLRHATEGCGDPTAEDGEPVAHLPVV